MKRVTIHEVDLDGTQFLIGDDETVVRIEPTFRSAADVVKQARVGWRVTYITESKVE